MILIKKETAHQLPALGSSQAGELSALLFLAQFFLTVFVPFEKENEHIFWGL